MYKLDEEEENLARPTYVYETEYQYKYNGKEWQDELGLNMYNMDMRQYDPAIARWVVMDPVVHHSMSPYNAFDNNPVFWADPSGADATSLIRKLWDATPEGTNSIWINTENDNEKSESTEEEPPTSLFRNSEENKIFLEVVKVAEKIAKKGDGKYTLFGHANETTLGNDVYEEALNRIDDVAKFIDLLKHANPQLLKDLQSGKEITLTMYMCNVASAEYINNYGVHIENNNPIAKQRSTAFPNAKIIAPNGYVVYGLKSNGSYGILGVRNEIQMGKMITFMGGKEVNSRIFDFNHDTNQTTKDLKK